MAEAGRECESLKRGLAARYGGADFSSQAYAEAKTELVTEVTERALAEGYPRAL